MRRYSLLVPALFLLPAIGVLFFLQFFAWGWNINLVLHDVTLMNFLREWEFVGLENFRTVLTDPRTLTSLQNTAIFAFSSISLQMIIGTAISYLLYRAVPKVERFFRPIVILPWLCSVLIAAFGWQLLLSKDIGLLNTIITGLGFARVDFFGGSTTAMISIVLANTWWGTPFTILLMGSGMTSISPQLIEASKVDGASEWIFFTRVALPIILPFILINLILVTVWTINMFGLILAMTGGGPLNATRVFPLHGYLAAFDSGNFSYGATVTVFSVMINIVLIYIYVKIADVELV